MPDLATIAAVFSSLKTATDIVKLLRESDLSLEKAELKLKLADLVSALADIKIQLVEVQETLAEKEKRIAELEEAFESRDALVRSQDAYYTVDASGNPVGRPFCLRCWEVEHKKRQLVHDAKDYTKTICTACGTRYEDHRTEDIQPPNGA